jgi:hypothetical protein
MKKLLLILSLIALSSLTRASDVELIQQTATDVYNLKIGETSSPVSVTGLSVRDQQSNRSVISLGDTISLQNAGVQLSGVLFAIVPPTTDGDPVTALILWQATGLQPETQDTLNMLVLDIIAHNGWVSGTPTIRPINSGETVPAGTQFWIGASSKVLALSGPAVCVADGSTSQ